jgi:hypothetical protein
MDTAVLVIGLIAIADSLVALWIALFKLEEIESHLTRCKLSTQAIQTWKHGGMVGRQFRLAAIYNCVSFHKLWGRHGFVHADDIKSMPMPLKFLIYITSVVGAVGLLTLAVLLKITGDL